MTKKILILILLLNGFWGFAFAAPEITGTGAAVSVKLESKPEYLLDERFQINDYIEKYQQIPQDILMEMIKDETLNPLKITAAMKVFNQLYIGELVTEDVRQYEKTLLRVLDQTDSSFVQIMAMASLCILDRYRYFNSMMPALIQKLNHYNTAINILAYESINQLILDGQNRAREARVVFNTIRKTLFLSRGKLASIILPEPKLDRQLKVLRWSIKVLGNQELQRLPREVIHLL